MLFSLYASVWEELCKPYVPVCACKTCGLVDLERKYDAFATFGQVYPGLPVTMLVRYLDKPESLGSESSFLRFLLIFFQTQCWESHPLSLPKS